MRPCLSLMLALSFAASSCRQGPGVHGDSEIRVDPVREESRAVAPPEAVEAVVPPVTVDAGAVYCVLQAREIAEIQRVGKKQAECYTCLASTYTNDADAARRLFERARAEEPGLVERCGLGPAP